MPFAQLHPAHFHAVRTKASGPYCASSFFARSGALRTTFVSASANQHSGARTEILVAPVIALRVIGFTKWLTRFPRHWRSVKHGEEVAIAQSRSWIDSATN